MNNESKLENILVGILGNCDTKKDERLFRCPFCKNPNISKRKLSINIEARKWKCWVCGKKGIYLTSLFKKLEVSPAQMKELREILADELPYYQKPATSEEPPLFLPLEFQPLWKPSLDIERKHALNYLLRRGVTVGDILRYNIGFCVSGKYANRIIIPSYDENNKLNYFVGRDFFDASTLKYMNPNISKDVIVFENHINWHYDIILCEGVMDAIAIKWNAIPLLGKFVPNSLRQKIAEKQVKRIYIALDKDAAREAIYLCQTFLKEGQEVFMVNLEDKDPSEVGFEGMQKAIQNAQPISFQDVIAMKLA